MAYALSLQSITDYGPAGKIMLIITIIYALISVLGIGSILNPVLKKCDVLAKHIEEDSNIENIINEDNVVDHERKRCC
jgi:NhaP-type Na+/H+ or K+/H+ antiporter